MGLAIGAVTVYLYSNVQSATGAITGLQTQLSSDEQQVSAAFAGQKSAAIQKANPFSAENMLGE